jgi:WD40 repeat protein
MKVQSILTKSLWFCFFIGLSLFYCFPANAKPLEFVKKIGNQKPFQDEQGGMEYVGFNRSGTMIIGDGKALHGRYGTAFWSFPSGKFIKLVPAFGPHSMSLNLKYEENNSGIAEVETGKRLVSTEGNYWAAYTFSPDSHYAARSNGRKPQGIQIFSLPDGKQVASYGQHFTTGLAISPDNRILASGHWNIVVLRSLLTGRKIAVLRGIGRYAYRLSFSKDGKLLAVGTDAGGLQVWDVRHRRKLMDISVPGIYVTVPVFSPDKHLVAFSAYGSGTLYLADIRSGKLIDKEKISDLICSTVAFSPDGRYLVAPSTGGLIKWPYDYGGTIRVFKLNASKN